MALPRPQGCVTGYAADHAEERIVDNQLVIHLKTGDTCYGYLARPFGANDVDIEVLDDQTQRKLTFSLDEVYALFFAMIPDWATSKEPSAAEEIQTLTGDTFTATVFTDRKYLKGFIGLLQDETLPFRLVFFTFSGVRSRHQARLIGEILLEEGLVTDDRLDETLSLQNGLRSRRMGEVIAETTDIPHTEIEKTLAESSRNPANAQRVGDILVEAGLVTREQVEKAFESQQSGKKIKVGELLVSQGLITEEQLLSALATKFRLQYLDLETVIPSEEALGRLSEGLASRLQVLPLEANGNILVVATSSPTDPTIGDSLRFSTNCNIELVVASSRQISAAIDRYYHHGRDAIDTLLLSMKDEAHSMTVEEEIEETRVVEPDSEVIALINRILLDAYKRGASDIHFEPGAGKNPVIIRYRIDGECVVAHKIPASFKSAIISRIKIISGLDIAERRKPQSGKIMLRFEQRKLEYRVEITPTVGGQEDGVMRLLSASKPLPLAEMGLLPHTLDRFTELLAKPYGIILCVGPTGSGKTTTLHSALGNINTTERKIWTAEDPVEITQQGLRQVQVNPKIGFNFAEALRSFLRADPDVIMIGEMRDAETARIAIEASLTGHLVFSTLHTNSAPETVVRLVDMGMDPFNFADALLGVMAQRLTKKLCDYCKKRVRPTSEEYDTLVASFAHDAGQRANLLPSREDATVMVRKGCERCGGSGYKGRFAIHELLLGTPAIKQAVRQAAGVEELRSIALSEGMWTLRMDGIMKVLSGYTDMEQIFKVCM
jgi:type II secretory ATPase GspE/PulE/Tfp pilus assembly ATPase PilB-like protein